MGLCKSRTAGSPGSLKMRAKKEWTFVKYKKSITKARAVERDRMGSCKGEGLDPLSCTRAPHTVLMIRFRLCSDTMSDHPKFDLSSTHVVLTLLCACTVPSWVCASKYRARNSSSSTLVESVLPSACMPTSESLKDLMCLGTTWYQLRIMQRTWQLFNPL